MQNEKTIKSLFERRSALRKASQIPIEVLGDEAWDLITDVIDDIEEAIASMAPTTPEEVAMQIEIVRHQLSIESDEQDYVVKITLNALKQLAEIANKYFSIQAPSGAKSTLNSL